MGGIPPAGAPPLATAGVPVPPPLPVAANVGPPAGAPERGAPPAGLIGAARGALGVCGGALTGGIALAAPAPAAIPRPNCDPSDAGDIAPLAGPPCSAAGLMLLSGPVKPLPPPISPCNGPMPPPRLLNGELPPPPPEEGIDGMDGIDGIPPEPLDGRPAGVGKPWPKPLPGCPGSPAFTADPSALPPVGRFWCLSPSALGFPCGACGSSGVPGLSVGMS
jgi:hypothetical protein